MNKKKVQKIENQSSISTNEFLNFKKEIIERIRWIAKKNKKVDEKLEQISQNILDIQTNTNKEITEINRSTEIQNDINSGIKLLIVRKCKDYNYLIKFLKKLAIKNINLFYNNKKFEKLNFK